MDLHKLGKYDNIKLKLYKINEYDNKNIIFYKIADFNNFILFREEIEEILFIVNKNKIKPELYEEIILHGKTEKARTDINHIVSEIIYFKTKILSANNNNCFNYKKEFYETMKIDANITESSFNFEQNNNGIIKHFYLLNGKDNEIQKIRIIDFLRKFYINFGV